MNLMDLELVIGGQIVTFEQVVMDRDINLLILDCQGLTQTDGFVDCRTGAQNLLWLTLRNADTNEKVKLCMYSHHALLIRDGLDRLLVEEGRSER